MALAGNRYQDGTGGIPAACSKPHAGALFPPAGEGIPMVHVEELP